MLVGSPTEHRGQQLSIKDILGIGKVACDLLLNSTALMIPEGVGSKHIPHSDRFDMQGHIQVLLRNREEIARDGLLRVGVKVTSHRCGDGG